MGERMLRRLRYELYDRILRFPPAHFRKVKQAELATMIKDEVEPLGGFIGDAFVQPMFLGGQALTAIIFIMMQNWLLGIIVIVLLAVQMAIIPRLRKPVLVLGRQRQISARQLAGRIAETADGVQRDPRPRRGQLRARRHRRAARQDLQDPLRPLPEEVRRQVLEQPPVAGDAVRHLPGRRLLRHHRPDGRRRRGRRAARLQGPALADQGADRLGPAAPGRADQVRAGDRPVPARGHDAARSCRRIPDGPPPPLASELALAGVTVSEDGRVKQLDGVVAVAADLHARPP